MTRISLIRKAPRAGELPGGLSYLAVGDGPPLVVLPGMRRGPEHSALSYRPLAQVTQREVFVVNRPSNLARGTTMAALAATHAKSLRAHFAKPVDVLGVSTGGTIALQLAVDQPGVVARLIVVAAASWLGEEGRDKLRRYGDAVAKGRSGAPILASVLAPPALQLLAAAVLWCAARFARSTDPATMLATIDAECGFDVRTRLGEVKAPTLVIAGGRDRAFPLALTKATAAGIRRAELKVYPRAGHLGTMLHPKFGSDVAEFLNRAR